MDILVSTSLRRIRAFLVVCETLHIGRAAVQMGIAQPALSEQIRGLESALGVKLFHRRKRGIDLTVAGEAYRAEAARLMLLHREAAETARRTARGEMGSLTIGYVASAMFAPQFPVLLGAMRAAYPDLVIQLREGSLGEVREALDAGDIDIALLRAPITLPASYAHGRAFREGMVVALSTTHRLAKQRTISISDLAAEPMVGLKDGAEFGIERVVADLAEAAGVSLNPAWRVSTMTSLLGLVAQGLGLGITPQSLSRIRIPGLCFRPLAGTADTELWYVWRAAVESPALARLLAMIAGSFAPPSSGGGPVSP